VARLAPTRLAEQLPAVFRERDVERDNFLERFLQAFEALFDGVRAEAALVTSLFAVNPTPSLRRRADNGDTVLDLDSAAGLCVGDVLQIEDVRRPTGTLAPRVEFATVTELRGMPQRPELPLPLPTLTPYTAELASPLRLDHLKGASVRRVGRPVAAAPLVGLPDSPLPLDELTLATPEALDAVVGDVVRVGRDAFEYAQVVATHGSVLVVTPPLLVRPPLETPVALLEPAPTTTPPPELEHAERSGRELVVRAPVRTRAARLELDSLTGLVEGDVVELRERDATRSELVRIAELPATEHAGIGIPTITSRVEPPLRFDHQAGTEVAVVESAGRATRLAAGAGTGASSVAVTDLPAVGLQVGAPVGVGTGATADYGHTRSLTHARLELDAGLGSAHAVGTRVAAVEDGGGETRLVAAVEAGARALAVATLVGVRVSPGSALEIGSGTLAETARVLSTSPARIEIDPPTAHAHLVDEPVARLATRSGGTGFLAWLASAVGLELRPDRGERWNRELVRLVGSLWRWRGTRRAVEELLAGYVRGEVGRRELPSGLVRRGVEVLDLANPMQLGLVSTLGYDTVLCGRPSFFRVDLQTESRSHRMHQPEGIDELVRATELALRREKPAHTFYDIHIYATTTQLGLDSVNEVGARLGETTLLWDEPLVVAGDEERRPDLG
jgi:hypothetical protein